MYLGPGEKIATAGGLSISSYGKKSYSDSDAEGLVDILFGSDWPLDITRLTEGFPGSTRVNYESYAKGIAQKLKPRYHFVSNPRYNVFWERQPFSWEEVDNSQSRVTRFISLADFQTKDQKWFYAFKIDVTIDRTALTPANSTTNPYSVTSPPKRPMGEFDNIWDENNPERLSIDRESDKTRSKKKRKTAQIMSVNPESCFFCLSNPKIDRALISSIGEEFYLALAKGPLISGQTKSQLGCPGHVLIIPMSHVPTYKSLTFGGDSHKFILEKKKYEIALKQMYSEHGLYYVSFEINRKNGVHVHTQVIPVPENRVPLIESTFKEEGRKLGIHLKNREVHDEEEEYFKLTLPDSSTLVASIGTRNRFDLQFGRRVMAIILGIEEQSDWRQCFQTESEEQTDCFEFKKRFKTFDFTL
ncbi:Drn1p [Sugiyamaella lignohabitans]|uniref:Drn1p n=1 Tax=Sugiyamaella lignohabitans TaxID=796027 RepID=A0A167FW89_9ASCO|nr:Drn1p [Sugiyamaella lignohabitans]ANB15781.1 Drn1p [Sugiyamaella lignohabitans]